MENSSSERSHLLTEICDVVNECVQAITSKKFENGTWVDNFPHGSCEITSVAIGRRLLELGYGDADLVNYQSNSEDGYFPQFQNHVWLELPLGNGEYISIDATAHQFAHLTDAPVVTLGPSPLRAAFKKQVWRRKISDPQSWHSDKYHAPILKYVSDQLGSP